MSGKSVDPFMQKGARELYMVVAANDIDLNVTNKMATGSAPSSCQCPTMIGSLYANVGKYVYVTRELWTLFLEMNIK